MYWVVTSRGFKKYFTHYKDALAKFNELRAEHKWIYYRTASSCGIEKHEIGEPDPIYKTGKNGLRFCMIAG